MSDIETEFEKQRSEWRADNARLREEIGRLKLNNLTNAIGRICPDCGHDTSEDGCVHCIKAAISPLLELLHTRIGDTSSGYYGSIKIDQPLIDTFDAAKEKLTALSIHPENPEQSSITKSSVP